MKSVNKCLIILVILFMHRHCHAQDHAQDNELLEKYIENTESHTDYTDLSIVYENLIKHPVNLNSTEIGELSRIPQFTPVHLQALKAHIQHYGNLTSIYELQVIDGFDPDLIAAVKSYIDVRETIHLNQLLEKDFRKNYRHEIVFLSSRRIEKSIGYQLPATDKNAFLGNPFRQAMRYKGVLNPQISFGCNIEKDDGEKLKTGFLSAFVLYNGKGKIKQFIMGDFQAAFGQGLCFGSGLSFGKSPFVLDIMRRQNTSRPNRSFNENEFLRGISCTYKISKHIDLISFYSNKRIDANVVEDSLGITEFSGLLNTGNYRNSTELSKKGQLNRRINGSHLQIQSGTLQIGATAVYTKYGSHQLTNEKHLYQLYNNQNSAIQNYGVDFKWFHKNLLFFGEVAMNEHIKSLSFVHGIIASLDKHFDISLLHRHYSMSYNPSITNAFGETQDNHNENGLYMGICIIPLKNFKLNAYADLYRFNWLRYQVDAPSQGRDMMIELQYTRRKQYSWYIRFRSETKQQNEPGLQIRNRLENQKRELFRSHLEYKPNLFITLKSRFEQVWFHREYGKTTRGMLMMQDLHVQVHKRIKLITRLMVFDAEDYDSRVYAFENDMLYSYSVPAFQNRGLRFYLLTKYKMNKYLYLCFRFARTSYENSKTIGSGQDKIESNKATDISIQLQWTL